MKNYLLPVARRNNIVVQELSDELLVYDLDKNKAICLNQTAKLIFEQCDGVTTLEKAVENIGSIMKTKVDNEVFWLGLEQLKKHNLIEQSNSSFEIPKVSRRDLIRSGAMLGIALPLISSMVAPSSVSAQSVAACTAPGDACFTDQNNMDNCCGGASCTMQVAGFCCIINTVACDPSNDFCCPGTVCSTISMTCMVT